MSLNPLNELKRRLEDETTPLPKRLCLAKNIVTSHHFPAAPKERIIAEWLEELTRENKLTGIELQKILEWSSFDDLTGELKSKLVRVVSLYVQKNILQHNDVKFIILFLENPKISRQLCQQIDDCLTITVTLLQFLKNEEVKNFLYTEKLLNNILTYYKESKKKLEFITKLLKGDNLETIFSYLETESRGTVINICQGILFPQYKKTYFISYLQTLIRKDNIEELIQEKGDNIQSVLKIMNVFFKFPEHRTEKDPKFLQNFIDVFVTCFKKEYQIVFAFYIMAANVLTMKQDYIIPSMNMDPISFEHNDEKIKRNLFMNMLEIVLKNEVDVAVRLTDTFGEKIPKVETKKTFVSFLQVVMMGQIKLEGKLDKTTLLIIKTALKLDPILVEQKMEEILPPLMASKKSPNVLEAYKDMLNCFLEILFKLSQGAQFLTQILPSVKLNLEACNTEQLKLEQEIEEAEDDGQDKEKLINKLITGNDVFPKECVDTFGRLTMDLMFRQNKDLLESLKKDFEVHCLLLLEEGFVGPSTITLTEVLSSIISSFLQHSKMAEHTVPHNIAEEFWTDFTKFEDCLRRLGLCTLKVDNNSLLQSFLKICLSYSQLKLLNIKYSNCKLQLPALTPAEEFNLSVILPFLSKKEWEKINGKIGDETVALMDQLELVKTMISQVISINGDTDYPSNETKSHLVKQLNNNPAILDFEKYFPKVLFSNLDTNQYKQLAKGLVKLYLNDEAEDIFNDVAITNNRPLLNALVLETAKNITKGLENCEALTKALNKSDFQISDFAKERNMQAYLNEINVAENQDDKIKKCIELFKMLRIPNLDENYQVTAIFVMLAVKKCCQSKKVKKNVDYVLQYIFELSLHSPDLYLIFPVNVIFSFEDTSLMDLLTLKIKTSNQLLLLKCIVEKAIKKVKVDSDLVKNLVNLLIAKKLHKNKSIEAFSDPAFQITCIILPLIVKQKQAIKLSAIRSILTDLQEKLHKVLLDTFKNINFAENGSLFSKPSNTEESLVESDANITALNAIAAFTLTLSKYCETTDVQEIQNLTFLWSGLEFFIQNAIQTISNPESKHHHIESSVHLLNVTLRHLKKLHSHPIFSEKDKIYIQIWNAINIRLVRIFANDSSLKKEKGKVQDGGRNCQYLEELGVTLRYVCELVSVEGFEKFLGDLGKLVVLKKPFEIIKDESKTDLTNHRVSKYIWTQCLKANTIGPKCGNMTKTMYQNGRNLKSWIRQNYDSVQNVASTKKRKLDVYSDDREVKVVKVHNNVCDVLRLDLETLSEAILAGKKITLDYKYLDVIFELLHMVQHILGSNTGHIKCEVDWQSFFALFESCVAILNSLLVSREELLEDRWPNYMQCYRALAIALCENTSIQEHTDRNLEEKLAEAAHSIEKLTQAISKRKKQVSRIAAYTVADLCSALERNAPSRKIRIHLENSIASLMQASDSSYAMAFLKRALAGSIGQMTMSNLYNVYKKYHKYTGNA